MRFHSFNFPYLEFYFKVIIGEHTFRSDEFNELLKSLQKYLPFYSHTRCSFLLILSLKRLIFTEVSIVLSMVGFPLLETSCISSFCIVSSHQICIFLLETTNSKNELSVC